MHFRYVLLFLFLCRSAFAVDLESKPIDPFFDKFQPLKAPPTKRLLLKKGDRLALCGDSITEQKMYSRIIETYLTVCAPALQIDTRQYGWSGERAGGFLARMTNDCLRFHPTIATTCYGMNDHEYRPYEKRIGETYREKSLAIVHAFKANHCRVVEGSPGCVGGVPFWVATASGAVDDLNLNLCTLRNIGVDIARKERIPFADVFWPMLTAGFKARERYGSNYAIEGKDGVHPGWGGQLVMAYAFLKALGLNGQLGVITVDLSSNRGAKLSEGHELLSHSSSSGELQIRSTRYPFCATNMAMSDDTIRSGMTLVPFNQELNRFLLIVKKPAAKSYKVTWGSESRPYASSELARGVNLAQDFPMNPFWPAFHKVDDAVAAKQAYETKQIKELFRGKEAQADMEAVMARSEKERAALVAKIKEAFTPVTHTIRIEPL